MTRGGSLEKEYISILFFGHHTSRTRQLGISKKSFKILLYVSALTLLVTIFFLSDYIQVKKRAFDVYRLHQEMKSQTSQIHFFSAKVEDLERQLSALKDFDRNIRIITNLERRGQGTSPLMGIGGPSPSDIREELKERGDEKALIRQMRSDIERLQSEAVSSEESFSRLMRLLLVKKQLLAHTPSIWPVQGWVTSGFGYRTHPLTGLSQMHEGLDIANRVGTTIIAPASGVVSGIDADPLFGNIVVISHGFGITTCYAHLHKVLVKLSQRVERGDKIAELGMSGRTTGPHLHYEVRINNIPANPVQYILN
jgi:murein DD-endopeptidase MepM/ murein hydrolase activator NlpD